ncbi:MAG: hypothetical protein FJ267_09385 [Planctomycetes bacterium]|nr:hypothetical protein [Planctomycetota bacterium]
MLHLRNATRVLYSLVYVPEFGEQGWWVEAMGDQIISGPDDRSRTACDVLRSISPLDRTQRPESQRIYVNGFQRRDDLAVSKIEEQGLKGIRSGQVGECLYEMLARGEVDGCLIHSPNVYDFPVIFHLCQILGGDAVWVRNGEPIDFNQKWLDARAKMTRLSGIVACSLDRRILDRLANTARNWNPNRYHEGDAL